MRVHEATVVIACTYRRAPEEGDLNFPDVPDPWPGEWTVKDKGGVSICNDAHECIIVYETVMSIWDPKEAKARNRLEEWIKTLDYDDAAPQRFAPDRWNRSKIMVVDVRMTGTREVPLVHSVSLPWSLLVDPTMSIHGSGAKPRYNSIRYDIGLHALHDLFISAEGYDEDDRWVTWKTRSLLSGGYQGSGFGFGREVAPIDEMKSIGARFQHALLAKGRESSRRWKKDKGISYDAMHILSRPVPRKITSYPSSSDLCFLMSMRGCRIKAQLNGMHEGARNVLNFGIALTDEGVCALLNYGYQGSSWTNTIAHSRLGEPIIETIARAKRIMDALVPDAPQQVSGLRQKKRDRVMDMERDNEYA